MIKTTNDPNARLTPNVAYVRKELAEALKKYWLITDCLHGEAMIKHRRTKYLPMPNGEDENNENRNRYNAYLTRAVFYNVTARTLNGLVGHVFIRDPIVKLPPQFEIIESDANGAGVSLNQIAETAMRYTMAYGRAGILADYPTTDTSGQGDGVATVKQLQDGDIRPTLNVYAPEKIINWRVVERGSREILSLVVLLEEYVMSDDGFEMVTAPQWRVLRLDEDGLYEVQLWRGQGRRNGYVLFEKTQPTDANGQRLNEIPFTFAGCRNNDSRIDDVPMYDLASLNIAHYRNSADYEESCFLVGQPTPYFAGLTEQWVKEVLKGQVVLGSRSAIPLPVGGTAGLLQAGENTMVFEAMQHKEKQMVALGAKLVEDKTIQRTAFEADIENTSETSILAASAKNVSEAIEYALKKAALFLPDVNVNEIEFDLNTDFDILKMTPQEQQQLVATWQAGGITFTEMRDRLKQAGIATMDDEEAKNEIAAELASAPDLLGGKPDSATPPGPTTNNNVIN